jgi:cobalt-zinc-cadmium resistance protein CzcA
LGQVHVGQPATIAVDAYPGRHFAGRVASISDLIDPQTRTVAVRCQVTNTRAPLKLDMLASVGFPTATNRSALSVPTDAVQNIAYSFSQPIEFRMQELIEGIGARSDVVIKIFGDDLAVLREQADRTARILGKVPGAADVKVEQTSGQPVLEVKIDREAIARYGINVADVQQVVQIAIAGTEATRVLEGFRRFELVVRLKPDVRRSARDFGNLLVSAPNGQRVPLAQLARIDNQTGPVEIARENGQRRISVEVNVRGRDIGSFVEQAQMDVASEMQLAPGYIMQWGGLWEHLDSGRNRLLIVVPVTFLLIFMLRFATFHSARLAALVFTGVPFAVTGGILTLLLQPFSMSAGVGFIAVSGWQCSMLSCSQPLSAASVSEGSRWRGPYAKALCSDCGRC